MNSSTDAYHRVQGLQRGLAILRALNRAPRGTLTISQLVSATNLHRTTIKRILETLADEGCVQRSLSDNAYQLTLQVRELSEGFTDAEWISQIAAPAMGELLKNVQWPSDLTTLDGSAMLIRESTHRFSPLSIHKAMVGRRMPLLLSASGRAYFAACTPQRREELVKLMIADGGEQGRLASNPQIVRTLIERVQSQGYGTNTEEWIRDSGTHAIALPILRSGEPIGCLNIVFLKRAMTIEQAAQRLLPRLQEAVAQIESAMTQQDVASY